VGRFGFSSLSLHVLCLQSFLFLPKAKCLSWRVFSFLEPASGAPPAPIGSLSLGPSPSALHFVLLGFTFAGGLVLFPLTPPKGFAPPKTVVPPLPTGGFHGPFASPGAFFAQLICSQIPMSVYKRGGFFFPWLSEPPGDPWIFPPGLFFSVASVWPPAVQRF